MHKRIALTILKKKDHFHNILPPFKQNAQTIPKRQSVRYRAIFCIKNLVIFPQGRPTSIFTHIIPCNLVQCQYHLPVFLHSSTNTQNERGPFLDEAEKMWKQAQYKEKTFECVFAEPDIEQNKDLILECIDFFSELYQELRIHIMNKEEPARILSQFREKCQEIQLLSLFFSIYSLFT